MGCGCFTVDGYGFKLSLSLFSDRVEARAINFPGKESLDPMRSTVGQPTEPTTAVQGGPDFSVEFSVDLRL